MMVSKSEVPPVHDGGLLIHPDPFAQTDSADRIAETRTCNAPTGSSWDAAHRPRAAHCSL